MILGASEARRGGAWSSYSVGEEFGIATSGYKPEADQLTQYAFRAVAL